MKTIRQKVHFESPPHEIYELLMDSEKHSVFTGEEAKISKKVGGKVSCYGGWIIAENVELIPDRKIVQKWKGKDWEKDEMSVATFDLREASDGGTDLEFTQIDVPDDCYEDIEKGWKMHYWVKMKRYLGE
jgi:activator of HSP90 ATPase